jgi:Lrp/AsnC family transcriptional regulator, leucine-responsive regulatory protein
MAFQIDDFDVRILQLLQGNCRQSMVELAGRVGLSPSACHRRVALLDDAGVISRYAAVLDSAALGLGVEFNVEIRLNAQTDAALAAFEKAVRSVPEILECDLMTGKADYILRVAARNIADYERLHRQQIGRLPHVARIESRLRLRAVKPWQGYIVSR